MPLAETLLYGPVKSFLESCGFVVKGEVGGCDLVALQDGEPLVVVIGELKLRFSLERVLQAIDRATDCDEVWLAARVSTQAKGKEGNARFRNLCRRFGFGMLGGSDAGEMDILVLPDAALPRRDAKRRSRLVEEHRRRRGDPGTGGGARTPIMTAHRQQALACAACLPTASSARATSAVSRPMPRRSCGTTSTAGSSVLIGALCLDGRRRSGLAANPILRRYGLHGWRRMPPPETSP